MNLFLFLISKGWEQYVKPSSVAIDAETYLTLVRSAVQDIRGEFSSWLLSIFTVTGELAGQ